MRIAFRLFAPLALVAAASLPALAADYDPPLVIEQEPILEEIVPVEIGSGWYLRGDVGISAIISPRGVFTNRTFTPATATYTTTDFDNARYTGNLAGISGGIGFGYRFTDWLRADVVGERFDMRFAGSSTHANPCAGQAGGTTCREDVTAIMASTSVMANVYADLGTFARFTPYVGAGAGVARARWHSANSTFNCVPGAAACAATTTNADHEGITSWRLTYAAMVGMAFDINKNLKLDLGYKFRGVGGGAMYNFSAADQAGGASGTQANDPGFFTHEIRLGLRYELW